MTVRLAQRTATAILLGTVVAFYLWTALSSGKPIFFAKEYSDYYNKLSDAFLAGRLSLLEPPRRELLELPDPYDPALNERYRMLDASLYKGKYYFYFGPAPAITLFIPYRFLFDRQIYQNLAVALFSIGGFIWSVLLLNFLTDRCFPRTPFWMRLLAIFCLSVSNVVPYILRRPIHFEVAISAGYFYLMGALFWLVSGGFEDKPRTWRLSLGSLFLGLAVGSRPNLVFAAAIPLVLWIRGLRCDSEWRGRTTGRLVLNLFGPFLVCMALLAWYNYARFESWTDFGIRYMLKGHRVLETENLGYFRQDKLLPGLFFLFVSPNQVNLEFPFFHLVPSYPWTLPKGYLGPDRVAGTLTNIPFITILILYPFYSRRLRDSCPGLGILIPCVILVGMIIAVSISGAVDTIKMRYAVDFVTLLVLPAILFWFYLHDEFEHQRIRRATLSAVSIILILYGCVFNLAISLTGSHDLLRAYYPGTYQALQRLFYPKLITGHLAKKYGPLRLQVRFANQVSGRSEPLVVTGRTGAGDFAFVKYLDEATIAFGFDHWGRGGPVSGPIRVSPDEIYDLEIHMGSLYPGSTSLVDMIFPDADYDWVKDLFLIELNGSEVLRDSSRFHPSTPSQVTVGENNIGGNVTEKYFSGSILSSRRIAPPRNHANP